MRKCENDIMTVLFTLNYCSPQGTDSLTLHSINIKRAITSGCASDAFPASIPFKFSNGFAKKLRKSLQELNQNNAKIKDAATIH